ncbi:MAG: type II toxin-antitoxin system Phd/YefM family antitoxin [Deltaproteobacteria bacterium]|nr:type II toxin-antitoxin system Phd/YefM family antitoxin [Deltaproteobacteria bacterium]
MAIRTKGRPDTYSIAQARDSLARIVHEAEQGRAIELTRRGKPVAAVVSVRDLERIRGGRAGLWETLVVFRAKADLEDLWAEGDPLQGVRDRSPGRQVRL